MFLGQIIIPPELKNNEKINALKIRGVLINETYQANSLLPTLIIGWKNVSNLFNADEISILNKTIKPNLFWTFAPEENKQDFNEDIETFISKLYNDLIKDVPYHFIDPIIENFSTEKELIDSIQEFNLFTYIIEDYIYSYNETDNIIWGVDLKYLKFLNLNPQIIIDEIKKLSIITKIEDNTKSGTYSKYNRFFNHNIELKYIPLLIYKDSFK